MYLVISIMALLLSFDIEANSSPIIITQNTKEMTSRILKRAQLNDLQDWKKSHSLRTNELKEKSVKVLEEALKIEFQLNSYCDLGFSSRLKQLAIQHNILEKNERIRNFAFYLREQQIIDDLLLDIIIHNDQTLHNVRRSLIKASKIPKKTKRVESRDENELRKMFKDLSSAPLDDIKKCSLESFRNLLTFSSQKKNKHKFEDVRYALYQAYKKNMIDLQTYKVMYELASSQLHKQMLYLKPYFNIAINAKNKLLIGQESLPTHEHTTIYASRRQKLTNREVLYIKYSPTQIVMLAQILEKSAKRLMSPKAYLTFEMEDEQHDIYVFSPLEQYRASLKLLRKDLGILQISPQFSHLNPSFDDIISAAYETGYIKSDELEHVLKFEDFWNPEIAKWRTYSNFVLSIGSTASFFLPPPWNIIGAIGLSVLQTTVINKKETPDEDANWNVII